MRIEPKENYADIHAVWLKTDDVMPLDGDKLMVLVKPGSFKAIDENTVEFRAMVPASSIDSLYKPPAKRLGK